MAQRPGPVNTVSTTMVAATINAIDLTSGRLPAISPFSGLVATERLKVKYSTAPAWTFWLILVGIFLGVGWIPGAIIRSLIAKNASGIMFVTADERKRARLRSMIPWALLLLAIALFVSTSIPQEPAPGLFVLAALGAFGAFIVMLFIGAPRLGPRGTVVDLKPGNRQIQLEAVHPAFAGALPDLNPSV